MKHIKIFLALSLLLPLSNCVFANTNNHNGSDGKKAPILTGSVSDSYSRKPMKGVCISVISIKDRIEKCFVTDASGKFMIPQFSSGEVNIVLKKKGYTTKRNKILLKEGTQLKMDVDMNNSEDQDESNLFHPLFRMIEY